MTIARNDDVLGGEPRVEGSRGAVRHVGARVVEQGRAPAHVADQFDLSLAEVYEALSWYYADLDEIRAIETENEEAFERVRERSLEPKEPVQ
jgi:uncharacterized protein (DUF433 family)